MSDETDLDAFLKQLKEEDGESSNDSSGEIDLGAFLKSIEEEDKAKPSEAGMPAADYVDYYIKQIFPSSKNNQGKIRGGLDGTKDILRFGSEAVTYPVRSLAGLANLAAGNKRGGDYGIGETYEESGEGYKKYNLPLAGEFSPMGFMQKIGHDPLNAAGGALGKMVAPLKNLSLKALGAGIVGATQESARPLAMEVGDDHIENIRNAGLAGLGLVGAGQIAGKGIGAGMRKIGQKIEPDLSKAAIAEKAHKANVRPESLEYAMNPENRAKMAQAHKTGVEPISDQAASIMDGKQSYRFLEDDTKTLHRGLGGVKRLIDLTPEHERLVNLRGKEHKRVGNENLESEKLKALAKTDEVANTTLGLTPLERYLELAHGPGNDISFIAGKQGIIPKKDFGSVSSGKAMHTAEEAYAIKQDLQDLAAKAYDLKSDVVPESASQIAKSAAFTRKEIRNALAEIGDTETLGAWDRIANKMAAKDNFQKQFNLKNDLDQIKKSLDRSLRNFENMTPRQREALKEISDAFGLDLSNQSRDVSYAKDLAPKGLRADEEWRLAGWDKWLTGKNPFSVPGNIKQKLAGENPAAAVRNMQMAKGLSGWLQSPSKARRLSDMMPPIYQRPDAQTDKKTMVYIADGGLVPKEIELPKKRWKSVADID